jgi:hypothetical protein
MSSLIEIQEPGDFVWTMSGGRLLAWLVLDDGTLTEYDPIEALRHA